MNRIHVDVRSKSEKHCKPLMLRFTLEGAPVDLNVVLDSLRKSYPYNEYDFELTQEETILHPLNPDLSIMHA